MQRYTSEPQYLSSLKRIFFNLVQWRTWRPPKLLPGKYSTMTFHDYRWFSFNSINFPLSYTVNLRRWYRCRLPGRALFIWAAGEGEWAGLVDLFVHRVSNGLWEDACSARSPLRLISRMKIVCSLLVFRLRDVCWRSLTWYTTPPVRVASTTTEGDVLHEIWET